VPLDPITVSSVVLKEAVMNCRLLIMTVLSFCLLSPVFADAQAPEAPEAPVGPVDMVTLKDGSVIYGEVLAMEAGLLIVKNPSAGELIKIKWAEVSSLKVTHPIPFQLKEASKMR